MRRTKSSKRLGKLLFFIPVMAISVLVVLGLVSSITSGSGTLVINAVSSGRYSPSVQLRVSATVGAVTQTTPFNLSLSQGEYVVVYGPKEWYATPPSRSVFLPNGRTEYAIAAYSPILRAIAITPNGFNSTSVTAMHGVTPVVWINQGNSVAVLEINNIRSVALNPSQNYTMVFSSAGTYGFAIFDTNYTGLVQSL